MVSWSKVVEVEDAVVISNVERIWSSGKYIYEREHGAVGVKPVQR
jgi:hypothetical protein